MGVIYSLAAGRSRQNAALLRDCCRSAADVDARVANFGHDSIHDTTRLEKYTTRLEIHDTIGNRVYTIGKYTTRLGKYTTRLEIHDTIGKCDKNWIKPGYAGIKWD